MTLLVDSPAAHCRKVGVVQVQGPDRLTYLHTLLSQHLEAAAAGTVADFLYLDHKGNAQAAGRAVVRAEDVLLVVPPDVAAPFAEALDRFRFLLQVSVHDVSADWALASIRGPGAVTVPGARPEPMTAAPRGGGLVLRDRDGGVDLLGDPGWMADQLGALDVPEADANAWEAWRISAGQPAWGSEIRPGRRPQELGLLPTHVHLRKGCYPGQESVAKIYNLGRPRRALAVVSCAGPLRSGMPVSAAGKPAEITSAAETDTGWVGLAFVPLASGQPPAALEAAELGDEGAAGQVRVVRLVGAGLPQPGAEPAAGAGAASAGGAATPRR